MSAVAATLELQGASLGLKWPNDLVAWKSGRLVKLGGILGKLKGDRMILGVGVNIWSAPDIAECKLPPACLQEVCPNLNPSLTTTSLALAVLNAWGNLTDRWRPSFYWPNIGDSIQLREEEGICAGWLPDGRLAVRTILGLKFISINLTR
jgi:BirA family biotin operon repressor/biotin-[acetyl-CoA-carboxylase] ligase